jgi:hypothetical protein
MALWNCSKFVHIEGAMLFIGICQALDEVVDHIKNLPVVGHGTILGRTKWHCGVAATFSIIRLNNGMSSSGGCDPCLKLFELRITIIN